MDATLAEMFNTNGYAEKVAEVRENVDMLLKIAEEEGVDLSELDEDEVVDLANELAYEAEGAEAEGMEEEEIGEPEYYAEGAEGEEEHLEGYSPEYYEGPENLGPKTAEADFLGRYMAHAMYSEQEKIAGEEAAAAEAVERAPSRYRNRPKQDFSSKVRKSFEGAKSSAEEGLSSAKKKVQEGYSGLKDKATKGLHSVGESAQKGLARAGEGVQNLGGKIHEMGKGSGKLDALTKKHFANMMKKHPDMSHVEAMKAAKGTAVKSLRKLRMGLGAGAIGLGAAGAGLAGYGAYKALSGEKKSHVEELHYMALEKAAEFVELAEEGYEVTFDKVASVDEDDIDRITTEMAWGILEEEGYI